MNIFFREVNGLFPVIILFTKAFSNFGIPNLTEKAQIDRFLPCYQPLGDQIQSQISRLTISL